MATELLDTLRERLVEDLDGLSRTDAGLEAIVDARFGELTVLVEHEPEAESLRVFAKLPPPAGAGPDFLLFCLATNTQYWDVKIGLDDDGLLVVHADLDADLDLGELATRVVDRVDTVIELIDGDLTDWLVERRLGTPAQRERWQSRAPTVSEDASAPS